MPFGLEDAFATSHWLMQLSSVVVCYYYYQRGPCDHGGRSETTVDMACVIKMHIGCGYSCGCVSQLGLISICSDVWTFQMERVGVNTPVGLE